MAAAEEKKEAEGTEGKEAPKKGKKGLIIIIVAVVLVLGGGGAAVMLMGGEPKEEHAEEVELPPHLVMADLGQFIVNLTKSTSFLKVSLLVEYDANIIDLAMKASEGHGGGHGGGSGGGGGEAAGPAGLPPFLKPREPMLKDAVIRVLSSKTSEEVLTAAGKDALKDELVEALNEAAEMDENPFVSVYFTEFIVQ